MKRTFILVALALALLPDQLFAQEMVRVKQADATVHLDASTYSPTIMTVPAGTLLEVSAKVGDWIRVLLPADAQGLRRSGYIAANGVEGYVQTIPPAKPASVPPADNRAALQPQIESTREVDVEVGARVGMFFAGSDAFSSIYGTGALLSGGDVTVWFPQNFGIQFAVDFSQVSGTPTISDFFRTITSVQSAETNFKRFPLSISGVYRAGPAAHRFYFGGGLVIMPYSEKGHVSYIESFRFARTLQLSGTGTATGFGALAGIQLGRGFFEFRYSNAVLEREGIFDAASANAGGPMLLGGVRY